MSQIVKTHPVPYYAVIFTSRRTEGDNGYARMGEEVDLALSGQQGYLGMESVRGADGLGITVSYWDSTESIAAWKQNLTHAHAKAIGRKLWYERYAIRICIVQQDNFFEKQTELQ